MPATIRLAMEDDAAAIREIYAPFCEKTIVSFEEVSPSADEIAARIRRVSPRFPWLVLDDDDLVAGYAYASAHHERAAYRWAVDAAVYVNPSFHRRGAGRALYMTLFDLLREQGFFKIYAIISLPNPASIGLHEAVGFRLVGIFSGVGYKFGAWHDVAHYQMALQPEQRNPEPPIPVSLLIGTNAWSDAVASGLRQYSSRAAD
jgi:phosphinothricin acetyltransferase